MVCCPNSGFLSGSKGGVSVCLKIWDQFFCFIGCHMPSTSPEVSSPSVVRYHFTKSPYK